MPKILILGRRPPPIGGVTTHVNRLIENLTNFGFNAFVFCDLEKENVLQIVGNILRHKIIHLHISNPLVQAVFALFCMFSGKILLITYHGDWGRYRFLGNWLVNLSARFCEVPIVQNGGSLKKAKFWNRRALLISTHLPAPLMLEMDEGISHALAHFKCRHEKIVCTNAWNVTFDRDGNEIYGILDIIRHVQHSGKTGLVVSDPSGNYYRYASKILIDVPENVLFIARPHDFRHVLLHCNAFIRNTTTDGVSISIHEAKELNIPILASAAVERPCFCLTFKTISDVNFERDILLAGNLLQMHFETEKSENPVEKIIQLYRIYTENGKNSRGS